MSVFNRSGDMTRAGGSDNTFFITAFNSEQNSDSWSFSASITQTFNAIDDGAVRYGNMELRLITGTANYTSPTGQPESYPSSYFYNVSFFWDLANTSDIASVQYTNVAGGTTELPVFINPPAPVAGQTITWTISGTVEVTGYENGNTIGTLSLSDNFGTANVMPGIVLGPFPSTNVMAGITFEAYNYPMAETTVVPSYTLMLTTGQATPLLEMDALEPALGRNLSLTGTTTNLLAKTLQVSLDGAAFGSSVVQDYEGGGLQSGTFTGAIPWLGTGPAAFLGTHTLQLQDLETGTTSNVGTYSVSQAETLTAIAGSAGHGYSARITGSVTVGTPATLDISYDGGNTFPDTVEVNYSTGGTFTLLGTSIL